MSRSESNRGKKSSGKTNSESDRRAASRDGGIFRRNSKPRGNAPKKSNGNIQKSSDPNLIRLNKYVANSGVCSRREADIYITAGNVTVNGKPITEMGHKVKLSDEVKFDGRLLNPIKGSMFF